MPSSDVRYTIDGPDALEQRIAADQQRVTDAVRALVPNSALAGLILAGGYGRGEGGFRFADGTPVPYNDYDYFVIVRDLGRGAQKALSRRLHGLAEALASEFGLEVDFAVIDAERLPRLPSCLMYSELKWRHRVLHGDPGVLSALRSPGVDLLPLAEFSRMMLNRGALLLMNARALAADERTLEGGAERFIRYVSKGVLAAGDAWLAAHHRYHPSTAERARRFLAWCAADPTRERVATLYALALQVKQGGAAGLPVDRPALVQLQRRAVAVWLDAFRALESARLGRPVVDWTEYAAAAVPKGQGGTGWRHAWHVANALRGGVVRALRAGSARLWRHPRERLLAALPLLLWAHPRGRDRANASLGLPRGAAAGAVVDAFFADWRRYC